MNQRSSRVMSLFVLAWLLPMELCCQEHAKTVPGYRLSSTRAITSDADSWLVSLDGDSTLSYHADSGATVLFGARDMILQHNAGHLRVQHSRSAAYFCMTDRRQAAGDGVEILGATLYSSAGDSTARIETALHFDEPLPQVLVRDSGGVVLGQPALGRLEFYDAGGGLVARRELFPGDEFDLERVLQAKEAAAGSVAVLATRRGAAAPAEEANAGGEPTVFLLDRDGSTVWQTRLPGSGAGELAVSRSGRHILAGSYAVAGSGRITRTSTLLDEHGQRRWHGDFVFRASDFSVDDRYAVLADRSTIHILDLEAGREIASSPVKENGGFVAAVRIGGEPVAVFVLVAEDVLSGGEFVYSQAKLNILDLSGALLQRIPFEDREFKSPALYISPSAERVGIGFRRELLLLESGR